MRWLAASSFARRRRKIWTQGEFADFEKGVIKNLSVRSDGLLTLAPRSHELFDPATAYLWALAQDSKGNLYAGGGTDARSSTAFRRTARARCWPTWTRWRSTPSWSIPRTAFMPATSPDGKIYRITGNGKPEVFYDPKAKYIWAMAFDSKGDLFVATGDQGEIHRVTPDGKGTVFFKSDETHVRSMAMDAERQSDRRHRAGRAGAAGFAGGRGLRAVPDGEAGSDRGGGGARRVDLRGRRWANKQAPAVAAPRRRCRRRRSGDGDGECAGRARSGGGETRRGAASAHR